MHLFLSSFFFLPDIIYGLKLIVKEKLAG